MYRKKSFNAIFYVAFITVLLTAIFCYPFFASTAYAKISGPIYSSWYVAENEPYGLNVKSLWNYVKDKTTYDVTYQKSDVVVAIIDSGLDVNHPYFKDSLWINSDEIANNGIDDDGNGVIDDINGASFDSYGRTSGNYDDCMSGGTASQYWHGTHVAGIVKTIAPNVKIMPIRAGVKSYSNGTVCSFNEKAVVEAILYAGNNGADIINLSFGTKDVDFINKKVNINADNSKYSIQDAINFAVNNCGAMVVGAMGNDGKSTNFYPACCDNVVSVMASNENGKRWANSNYLLQADIAAPGFNVLSTIGSSVSTDGDPIGYGLKSGTSMAAPYVCGVSALLMSVTGVQYGKDIVDYVTNKNLLSSFDYANSLGSSNLLLDYTACKKILDSVIDGEGIPEPSNIYKEKISCYDNEKLTINLKNGYVGEAEWYNNGELKNVGYSYTFSPTENTLIEVRVNGVLVEAYEVTVSSYRQLLLTIILSVLGGLVLVGGVSAVIVYFYIKKKKACQ